MIKTDGAGEIQWYQTFGGAKADFGLSVRQTTDGGYIFTGKTYSFGEGSCDVWLVKTDSLGNEEWSRTFGGSLADAGNSVWQSTDGGYIIVGKTYSFGVGECDVWLIKTDELGNPQWQQLFGGSENDSGRAVQQTADGGYIIGGYTGSFGAGNWDSWLIKTDSAGVGQWQLTSGGTGTDGSYSVQQTADGGYITAGFKYSPATNYDMYVIKVDPAGVAQWKKSFGGAARDYGMSVQQTTDGGYIVTGYTYSYGEGESDLWLIKLDSKGNQLWNRTFGGPATDDGRCVREIAVGQYIVTGYTASLGAGERDIWLIKALSPELAHINLLAPSDQAALSSPPTFKWSITGGTDNAYAVDTSLTPDFEQYWSTYENLHLVIRQPLWKMPSSVWNKYPSGSQLYWRVQGTDLSVTPQIILTSDEVWTFFKE